MVDASVERFKADILAIPLDQVAQDYVFEGTPFVFRDHPDSLAILRRHLRKRLRVREENVIVVGSAKLGFSLSPDRFPRQFSAESDIDILVVDENLFDKAWLTLLRWHYPKRLVRPSTPEGKWLHDRKENLFWGYFVPNNIAYEGLSFPDELAALRDLSTSWFNAFQSLSQYTEFVSRSVSGRLYRSWDHAISYHVEGLRQVREIVRSQQ